MAKQTPVFDLVVAYMLWKSTRSNATLRISPGSEPEQVGLATEAERQALADRFIAVGHGLDRERDRVQLCRELGQSVGVDYDSVVAQESFRLLSFEEARRLRTMGVDLALHTHRHRFPPEDPGACSRELQDNRHWLEQESGARSSHFCYPSGVYTPTQWPLLANAGVVSATTCDIGLVRSGDPMLGLRRFLDGEMVTDLEFEAELCGFAELLRGALRIDRGTVRR
jgi:peptidoglycan/xylan/chitin deacetylase (PgdA/CDA1 family)